MKKFNDRGGFGKNRGGSDRRDSRSGGFNRRDRDSGRPEMHQATCSGCGRSCEVPFKPTGDKPVYCSECFKTKGGAERRNFGDRDFSRRPNLEDKKMFKVTCAECGRSCEVPFKPTGDKPVYCSECFGQSDKQRNKPARSFESGRSGGDFSKSTGDFNSLNAKLDKIIQSLNILVAAQPKSKEGIKEFAKEAAKEAKEIVKDVKAKVAVAKKTVTKAIHKATAPKAAPKAAAKKKAKKK